MGSCCSKSKEIEQDSSQEEDESYQNQTIGFTCGSFADEFSGSIGNITTVSSSNSSTDEYISGYNYVREIWKGFGSSVFEMTKDKHIYAVKACDITKHAPSFINDKNFEPTYTLAFIQKMCHPNIIKFHEVLMAEQSKKLYIVMEMGGTRNINDLKTLEEKIKAYTQILRAIEYIHFNRIAHMDIKITNIIITPDHLSKLIDFANAIYVPENESHPEIIRSGAPQYTSPEIIQNDCIDPFASDIWSAGVVLYGLIFGTLPFHGSSINELRTSIVKDQPTINHADTNLNDLLNKMLEKNPKQRITISKVLEHPFIKPYAIAYPQVQLLEPTYKEISSIDISKSYTIIDS